MKLKKCPRCGKVLPESMFAPNTRHCKFCRRDYDWQYAYGISPEQYLELHNKQNGKCAICGTELESDYLHIDHDYETGDVRGLLCGNCNKGLGMFKDNIEYLKRAIQYLRKEGTNDTNSNN